MFWLISGLVDIATSPIRWVAQVIKDVSWDSWEEQQLLSMMTMWLSSIVKGTAKWIKEWADKITGEE